MRNFRLHGSGFVNTILDFRRDFYRYLFLSGLCPLHGRDILKKTARRALRTAVSEENGGSRWFRIILEVMKIYENKVQSDSGRQGDQPAY